MARSASKLDDAIMEKAIEQYGRQLPSAQVASLAWAVAQVMAEELKNIENRLRVIEQ